MPCVLKALVPRIITLETITQAPLAASAGAIEAATTENLLHSFFTLPVEIRHEILFWALRLHREVWSPYRFIALRPSIRFNPAPHEPWSYRLASNFDGSKE